MDEFPIGQCFCKFFAHHVLARENAHLVAKNAPVWASFGQRMPAFGRGWASFEGLIRRNAVHAHLSIGQMRSRDLLRGAFSMDRG
jgi:hypothetical protein